MANVGQLAFLAASLSPHRQDRASQDPLLMRRMAQEWGGAEWGEFKKHDWPHVTRFLWGWVDETGRHPGQDLKGAYEAWLRAAATVDADPRRARAVMEMCRQRMAACPGGPELLRLYDEYRHAGKRPKTQAQVWRQAVEAMRRAWRDSEPARQTREHASPHEGAPQRDRIGAGRFDSQLPVHTGHRRHGQSEAGTAAGEAAHLLGFPEVTLPQLHQFQHQYGDAVGLDGETLARQWLEAARRSGLIDQAQHDAWRDVVTAARRSEQHARWRVERGLDAPPQAAHAVSHDLAVVRHEGHALRGDAAGADHVAGHAGQHHHVTDRKLGLAADDPRTEQVDEQNPYRQRANTERGVAEWYDGRAGQAASDQTMAARMAAARPAPAVLARAQAPTSLEGKRPTPVVAVRPSPPPRPSPGRGQR